MSGNRRHGRTENDLELHHSAHDLTPQGRFSYRGVDYVVALGGPFEVWFPISEDERWLWQHCPDGYYEFAWAVLRDGKPWIGGSSVIDKHHDIDQGWTNAARERARINAARRAAEWAIDNGIKDALELDS